MALPDPFKAIQRVLCKRFYQQQQQQQQQPRLWHLVTLVRADPAAERREYLYVYIICSEMALKIGIFLNT